LGKQLDSLADMVTSGVVPGIIMFNLLSNNQIVPFNFKDEWVMHSYVPFLGLIVTLGACYRLAKFNIDTRQSDSFIGLPTPAMTLFVISLPLIKEYSDFEIAQNLIDNNYFLCIIILLLTYLMNAELGLFSLKFKEYSIKKNLMKYLFLVVSIPMILFLKYVSIPLIIIIYIVLSLISNYRKKLEFKN
jgi:CDP-diacylglycerol--serine O-phosphatidyltransferase